MKKLLFITLLLLSYLTLNAQKCIVLDFKIGENVTAEDVDAISYEFRSSFIPSCYTVEDYLRLKRTMKDLNYDPTTMRKDQIRKLGRDMVAVVVVYGTLEKFMNEYSLDVLVMDISTGTTIIHESSTFQQSEYHSHPRKIAKGIASKLCNTLKNQSEHTSVEYVDLGLPSKILWASKTEDGLYTQNEALEKFGNNLPTISELYELHHYCRWEVVGNQYKISGPNGNFILLPANGSSESNACYRAGEYGCYWSSTIANGDNEKNGLGFYISNDYHFTWKFKKEIGRSVRLVKRK